MFDRRSFLKPAAAAGPAEMGDIFFADVGTIHVAKTIGVARILVVETQGSV